MNLYSNVSGGTGGAFTVLITLDFIIDSCVVNSNGMQKRTEICSQNRM